MVTSIIATFPTLCPNLQDVDLSTLTEGPTTTAAVSAMLLVSNRGTLRRFRMRSPLTEEAREVVYTLPNLRTLWAVVSRDTPLPSGPSKSYRLDDHVRARQRLVAAVPRSDAWTAAGRHILL